MQNVQIEKQKEYKRFYYICIDVYYGSTTSSSNGRLCFKGG